MRTADSMNLRARAGKAMAALLVAGSVACLAAGPASAGEGVPASVAQPQAAPGYSIDTLVPGSPFQTINGLAFDGRGDLYVASMVGESLYAIARDMRGVTTLAGPPRGQSDDVVATADGGVIWTAMMDGVVRRRDRDGTIRDIASGIPGVNPIALSRDGKRLFVGQMLFGDSLWEVDPAGRQPARKIAAGIGSINAFAVGSDGYLYAPRWSDGAVVKIALDTGAVGVLATGLGHPVSVRNAPDGGLLVLDGAGGNLYHWRKGKSRRIARLASASDNLALGRDGQAYVSNMADGSIDKVDLKTGKVKPVFKAKLSFARDIAASSDGLYVADGYALRRVDPATGAIEDILRPVASDLRMASGISVADGKAVVTSELFGLVQVVDLKTRAIEAISGFDRPVDAVRAADGRLLVLQALKGDLIEVTGGTRRTVVSGLQRPAGIAAADDGKVYVAESAAGVITVIDPVSGDRRVLASGLGKPRAVALGKNGLAVLDVGGQRVLWIDRATGKVDLLARDVPVGHLTEPFPRSGGITIGADGAIFVAADKTNAILRIRK